MANLHHSVLNYLFGTVGLQTIEGFVVIVDLYSNGLSTIGLIKSKTLLNHKKSQHAISFAPVEKTQNNLQ